MAAEPKTFEAASKRLDELIKAMESGELPLDKMIAAFEEGARISSGDMAMDEVTLEFTDTAYWFVEKDGVLIEAGNHDELMAINGGFYKSLHNSQFQT